MADRNPVIGERSEDRTAVRPLQEVQELRSVALHVGGPHDKLPRAEALQLQHSAYITPVVSHSCLMRESNHKNCDFVSTSEFLIDQ